MRRSKEWEPGEKEAINQELHKRPLYLCDPDKNADCPKDYCAFLHPGFGECNHTLKPNCAKTDRYGTPCANHERGRVVIFLRRRVGKSGPG